MNDKNNLLDLSSYPINKEEVAKLKEIIEGIEADPKAYDFLEPVDHQGLGLFDYTTIVKNQKQIIFKTESNSGKVNSNKILERVKTARDRDSIKNK